MDEELTMAIAELMGWKVHPAIEKRPYDIWEDPDGVFGGEPPPYPTDWGAAGQVVEKMITGGYSFDAGHSFAASRLRRSGCWYAAFPKDSESWEMHGESGPHAICLAAKAALEHHENPTG